MAGAARRWTRQWAVTGTFRCVLLCVPDKHHSGCAIQSGPYYPQLRTFSLYFMAGLACAPLFKSYRRSSLAPRTSLQSCCRKFVSRNSRPHILHVWLTVACSLMKQDSGLSSRGSEGRGNSHGNNRGQSAGHSGSWHSAQPCTTPRGAYLLRLEIEGEVSGGDGLLDD